jgi:putative Holliday junction resolvase
MSPGMPDPRDAGTPPTSRPGPVRPELVLALDYGLRRIGVAVADTLTRVPRPLAAIAVTGASGPGEAELGALARVTGDLGAARLVVGCPYNADGSEHPLAARARAFGAALAHRRSLPLHTVDERHSSLEAAQRLRGQRATGLRRRRVSKAEIDSHSAAVILERWLSGEGDH